MKFTFTFESAKLPTAFWVEADNHEQAVDLLREHCSKMPGYSPHLADYVDDIERGNITVATPTEIETKRLSFLWTTASGAWIINADTRDEAYEKVIKNRMDAAFPGMSEEDRRAEAEGWFVQEDQLVEIDGELI